MKIIYTNKNQEILVDDADHMVLNKSTWHINNDGYAMTNIRIDNKRKLISMTSLLIETGKGEEVDHKDLNKLNNQRKNLRKATHGQNRANIPGWAKSGYKGVYPQGNKWESAIRKDGKYIYIGSFDTKEEAARAYDEKAKELHGEFAKTNFK